MKFFLKILFFFITLFQTNIVEAKIFVLENIISSATFFTTLNSEKSSVELESIFSENELANTCKSEGDLVAYRNWSISSNADAAKAGANIKYLGRMEDLKGIPRSQTILDDLPNLGSPKANYYQNMSVIRKNLREGVTFKDASWFRPNSELAPKLNWPTRTVGQTFYGAERNLMQNRGLWPK